MERKENKFSTHTLVLIGMFAALCYVALIFKIPIPSPVGKPFLHMGNMFVILAALLFSGPIGGLSGSLGMGLFDLMNGYASSAPKTLILKFGIGAITGIVASKGHKKDAKSPIKFIGLASALFLIVGVSLFIVSYKLGFEIKISGFEKSLVISPLLYTFCIIIGFGLAVACFAAKKLSIEIQYAVLGAVCGIAFNLVGEFLFKSVTLTLAGSDLNSALIASSLNLPATLINGCFSILVAIILYIPISKALYKTTLYKSFQR